jgi:multiple sugar transport system permease protein
MTGLSLSSTRKKQSFDTEQYLIAGKRRRKMREALIGYLFVLPATLATVIFGLWPVVAGFYESIKAGSPITNKYVGMANYTRALGSLIYILLFALCAIFLLMAYRAWQKMIRYRQERGGNPWLYLVPGLLVATGFIVFALVLVTGVDGYSWAGMLPLLLGVGGLYAADFFQPGQEKRATRPLVTIWAVVGAMILLWIGGPRLNSSIGLGTVGWIVLVAAFGAAIYALIPRLTAIRTGQYVSGSLTMGAFMLLALVLGRYTVSEMHHSTAEAQQVASQIFNQRVLDGVVSVAQENAQISGLKFEDGEVIVKVSVNGQTIEAPLAPQVYNELAVDKITRVETAFANGQKVQVVLPDGSVAEGQLTGVAQGEKLSVGFTADKPQATSEIDIYSALDVGEAVIQNNGHTEPLLKQIYASLGILLGMAAIYTMTWVRRHTDDDEHPRIYRWLHRGRVLMGIAIVFMFYYLVGAAQLSQQAAAGMGALSEDQFKLAYEFATGQAPPAILRAEALKAELLYWPQAFSVGIGALLIGAAYLVWHSAQKRETPLGFMLTILLAVLMMVGGWLVLGELPRTLALGGRETQDAMDALRRTAIYSVGTVPIQLALGLFLAYLLFSEIKWGKSLYRVVYFMPYIAPSVATSTVFLVIFRLEPGSLANRFVGLFGMAPQTWLKEPNGIFRIIYEQVLGGNPLNIPAGLAGPSLALTTVILYNIWVFAGYNTVVFLAGLGAIPRELYEAAEVDGAGRWSRFRSITLPLLSPTTFFLSMLSIIGTFKAFTHIYVLRRQATGKEIDTMSVHIFNTLYSANDPGYAAALAFTLFGVILVLTLVQNRLAKEQVFYG